MLAVSSRLAYPLSPTNNLMDFVFYLFVLFLYWGRANKRITRKSKQKKKFRLLSRIIVVFWREMMQHAWLFEAEARGFSLLCLLGDQQIEKCILFVISARSVHLELLLLDFQVGFLIFMCVIAEQSNLCLCSNTILPFLCDDNCCTLRVFADN